ncbi:MAG TPA: energy transducer TonB [Sphingomicrobium sp.]|jgi:TonB family protein|nr:energy transducer TonB [Sphingomicrobium sp.]
MLGASLLIAGSVVAATPVTPLPWFEFRDYPMKAFDKNQEGVTRFQLLVSPEGSIESCKVTSSSGHDELDTTTCYLAQKRVKFQPARDAEGRAVWGIYRSQAVWAIPDHRLYAPPAPDLEVTLNKLPDNAVKPTAVKLAYAVDANGTPSSCTMMPDSLRQPQVLVDVGCKQLLESADHKPVLGPTGQPVPAVVTGAVLFKTSDE